MNLDKTVQQLVRKNMTLEDALPTTMPTYVNSFSYFFGTMTLASLGVISVSGFCLAVFGPTWWHHSSVGHFINSTHFWGTEIFYFSLVLHMLTKFLKAAWRDGRWRTWIVGSVALAVSFFVGITGTLVQTDWDAQWNVNQGKDAFAALGMGWINPTNVGQLLLLHVVVFPILLIFFVAVHIVLVRNESPVNPIVRRGKEEHSKEECDE